MRIYLKQHLSLLLVLCLVLTLQSPAVFAEDLENEQETDGETTPADEEVDLSLIQFEDDEMQPTSNDDLYYHITGRVVLSDRAHELPQGPEYEWEGVPDAHVLFSHHNLEGGGHIIENVATTDGNGEFEIYLLKTDVQKYMEYDPHIMFEALKNGYVKHIGHGFEDVSELEQGVHIYLPLMQGVIIGGTFPVKHLPAEEKPDGDRNVKLYRLEEEDWVPAASFLLSLNYIGNTYSFDYLEPGTYIVAFAYGQDIFQYYNNKTDVEEAEILVLEAGDERLGIDTVTWAGDRDHALDTYPPYVVAVSPSGVDRPSSGNITIEFSEPMKHSVFGTVTLKSEVDEPVFSSGGWTTIETVEIPYTDLTPGRLYTVTIAGFQDEASNEMEPDSRHSFAVAGGHEERELVSASDIKVEGALTPDAKLDVETGVVHDKGTDDACDAIHNAQGEGLLLSLHGVSISNGSFTGTLTITMPIPEGYNGRTVTILHCKSGTLESLSAVVTNDTVTFELDSLSPIGIALPTLKVPQDAPAAPELDSKDAISITLKKPASISDSVEYRQGLGSSWQSSGIFTGLTSNTVYSFYMRLAGDATHDPSPASPALTVTTDKAALTGWVTITGQIMYGETLTAYTDDLSATPNVEIGDLSYQWKRVGLTSTTNIGTNSPTYQIVEADIGDNTITVTVTAENCTGEVTSNPTDGVSKAYGPEAPVSVTGSYTGNGTVFTYTVNVITGAEYRMDGENWQDSNAFSGILPSSSHTFSARIKETSTHNAGDEGNTGSISFVKLDDRSAPELAYTVSGGGFHKTVTITPVTGAEYKFNSGEYSATNTYTSVSEENVTLYIRLKETATHNASTDSSLTINTANQNQAAPAPFTLAYANVNDTSYTVTIPATEGAEYSFGGSTWSSDNTKINCLPGETITGYKRMAAKTDYNASSATSASITLPLFQVKKPTASPNGGRFTDSQSVSLSCATNGASIYYTTDGSAPATGSILYNSEFIVSDTTTVKVIAVKDGMTGSEVLSVTFTKGGGSGSTGGGSSSGGSVISGWTIDMGKGNDMPATATKILAEKPDKDGKLSITVTKNMVEEGLTQAKTKWSGRAAYGIAISFDNNQDGAKSLTTVIEATAIDHLVSQGVRSLTIRCGIYRITLDEKAIKSLDTQSVGNVTVTVTPFKAYGGAAIAVGTRPVFDISFKDSNGNEIAGFGTGTITRGISYTAAADEKSDSLFIVKIADGKAQWIDNSGYDNGWMLWSGSTCSVYGVGYKTAGAFMDTANHWAKDSIDFVVNRGMISGTTVTAFDPDSAVTRADFLAALGRLSGADVSGYKVSGFSDVNANDAAMPYIEWAAANQIVQGIGNNQFGPKQNITREQMAVMMQNYAKVEGYTLPESHQYSAFSDDAKISTWAAEAVKAIAQADIIVGKDNNQFDPQASATRAEAATILRRYVELVIDDGKIAQSTAADSCKIDVTV